MNMSIRRARERGWAIEKASEQGYLVPIFEHTGMISLYLGEIKNNLIYFCASDV